MAEPNPQIRPAKPARRPRAVTMKDVALRAGVAQPTVSAILNDDPRCYASEKTRQRVLEAARTLGYRVNLQARALHGLPTQTIGLIVPSIENESVIRIFSAFQDHAGEAGRAVLTAIHGNDADKEDAAILRLMDRSIDGLAIYPSEAGVHTELERLVQSGFPVVTFDSAGKLPFPTVDVSSDCYMAGRLQVRHVASLGRRRVCVVTARQRCHVNDLKLRGLLDEVAELGLPTPLQIELDLPGLSLHPWATGEFAQLDTFLRDRHREFDAFIGFGDSMALAVLQLAVRAGIAVPRDLAIIGLDDSVAGRLSLLPLSTIGFDFEHSGRKAFELLDRLIQTPPALRTDPETRRSHPTTPMLIARASTVG